MTSLAFISVILSIAIAGFCVGAGVTWGVWIGFGAIPGTAYLARLTIDGEWYRKERRR